ncbi:MAG: hypothetical protein AAFY58_00765 [Planctomycetota bacterium]
MMIRSESGLVRRAAALCVMVATGVCAAQADRFVREASEPPPNVRDDRRSDLVLLPALAQLDAPPGAVESLRRARMIAADDPSFAAAATWAQSAAAKGVLEALATVTDERRPRRAFAFAQGYGVEAATPELAEAGLYTDLGSQGLLALAEFGYRAEGLDRLTVLVHIEATRRAAAGEVAEAIELLTQYVVFERQLVDRAFMVEQLTALRRIIEALERIRDVAYVDFEGDRKLAPSQIPDLVSALENEDGFLRTNRISFPFGDRLLAEQLVERVYGDSESVDRARFGTVMAELETYGRPLRLFGQAGAWASRSGSQATRTEVLNELDFVIGDYEAMWALEDPYHPQVLDGFYADTADVNRHAAALSVLPNGRLLFAMKHRLRVEIAGTRSCLAVVGYAMANNGFPPTLAACRPRFIDVLEGDAMSPTRTAVRLPPLGYIASTTARRSEPPAGWPHAMSVAVGGESFLVEVPDSEFVLYSVGIDGQDNSATRVTGTPFGREGTDHVIWPPAMSLERSRE